MWLMPNSCASTSTISWRRKRRPKRRKLPQPRPSPRRLARRPLQPDLPRPLLPQGLPRFRKLLRRRSQAPRPNQPLLRPLLRFREPFRRDRRLLPRLLLMLLRLQRIPLRIPLWLQSPALLPLRPLLRHPRLRQGPAHPLRTGHRLPQDPRALPDNRARHILNGQQPHLRDSDRQVLARLLPHNDILRAPAVRLERDRGVPACHRVTGPAAVPAALRARAARSVPVDLLPDFRSVRGIAPIKVRWAASAPAREFPRRSRANRSMRASRQRADVR